MESFQPKRLAWPDRDNDEEYDKFFEDKDGEHLREAIIIGDTKSIMRFEYIKYIKSLNLRGNRLNLRGNRLSLGEDIRKYSHKKRIQNLSENELYLLKEQLISENDYEWGDIRTKPFSRYDNLYDWELLQLVRTRLSPPKVAASLEHQQSFERTKWALNFLSGILEEVRNDRHLILPTRMKIVIPYLDALEYPEFPDFD